MTKTTKLLCILLSFSPFVCLSASLLTRDYNKFFKQATEEWLPPGYDWKLLKAQCFVESRLKPTAVSPAGAYGLCQIMPDTGEQIVNDYDHLFNLWIPEQSIHAAAIYMNWLITEWDWPRPEMDRYMLALASYNAGLGNILAAQQLCNMALRYADIVECLPQVTGTHSKETIDYVHRIVAKWYPVLLFSR